MTLLTKPPDAREREWYAAQTIANGWSRTTQLNFYLSAVDAQVKAADDQPTIDRLLCKTKNKLVAEYALSGIAKTMGVAEYQRVRALPEPLDTEQPTIESPLASVAANCSMRRWRDGAPASTGVPRIEGLDSRRPMPAAALRGAG